MKMTKKQYIIIFLFILLVSSIIVSSRIGRFTPTHMIVKQVSCISCHPDEMNDVEKGNHITMMTDSQDRFLADYVEIYGNDSEPLKTYLGACYSCHITYVNYERFGLTDPFVFRNANGGLSSQYGYIINWPIENNLSIPGLTFNGSNATITAELKVISVEPVNSSIDSTLKIILANYSGQQNDSIDCGCNAVLYQGETQIVTVSNISEDYFKIAIILDGLWDNATFNLRVNDTDKGTESFSFTAGNVKPFVYEAPFSSGNGAYYFRTNGIYKIIRLDYIWSEWKNYSLENITTSEVIRTNNVGGWINASTCSAPDGMCHISQKATYLGINDGINPDKSFFSHEMRYVTSLECKLCHLRNSRVWGDCIGCHQTQQGNYPAVDIISFSIHKNINIGDGMNGVTNGDCKGCHYITSNMMEPGFTVPTRACADCHTMGSFSAPIIRNHRPNGINITTAASCTTCHGNTINKYVYSMDASVGHYGKYVTNIATIPYQHFGPINTSNCIECHNGPYTNDPNWGSPVDISTSTKRQHNETQTSQCDLCHNDGSVQSLGLVDFHHGAVKTASGAGGGSNCMGCHQSQQGSYPAIDTMSFSTHMNVNIIDGADSLTNNDCQTCHYDTSNMMQPGFSVATKACTDCHTQGSSAPIVWNHIPGGISVATAAYCSTCHNNMVNRYIYSENASIGHYGKYVTDRTVTPYLHFGPINTSNCIECHNGPYTNDPNWGSPVDISTSTKRQHNETQTSQCDLCHNDGSVQSLGLVDFHNVSVKTGDSGSSGSGCTSCHTDIANLFFGKHENINTTDGANILSNSDCKGCHFGSFQMATGAANFNNTYFCQDCHAQNGRNTVQYARLIDANLIKTEMPPGHAQNKCEQCHITGDDEPRPLSAEYKYHTNGPTGTAYGKNCFSCHYRSDGIGSGGSNIGLTSKPFNAPGEDHNCLSCHGSKSGQVNGRPTSCAMCHISDNNHNVAIGDHNGIESISINSPIVTSPANASDITNITTTISSRFTQIVKAQYRIIDSGNNVTRDWTDMNASDGRFDERIEDIIGNIDTAGLLGSYTVQVKGMSSSATGAPVGGINHDPGKLYYPDNGVWTDVKATILEVI